MTRTPFDLLVYDFDGTLVDTKEDIARAVNRVLAELGLAPLPPETVYGYVGRGVGHLLTCALAGTGREDVPFAVELFMKHYDAHLMDRTRFYPNCRETVEFFAHKPQAILSNKPARFITRILEELGCRGRFARILGGDSVEHKKPHPEGLHRLLAEFGLAPGRLLLVGDSPLDVETGRAAGVATCAVTWGLHPRDRLEAASPDFLIDDMAELQRLVS